MGLLIRSEARYKPRSAAWVVEGTAAIRLLPMRAGRGLRGAAHGGARGYLWFDGVRVFAEDMRLLCVVAGRVVPLPVALLHPDCRLAADGDVGCLGVPRRWAEERGLRP